MSSHQTLYFGEAVKGIIFALVVLLIVPMVTPPAVAEIELFSGNPLLDGVKAKDSRRVTAALENGESVEVQDFDGRGPLIYAALVGSLDVLDLLINRSADVNHRDKLGNSALFYAASQGDVEICEALITAGAKKDIENRQGLTPLMASARSGHFEIVQLLLAKGANPRLTDYTGRTALKWAEWNRQSAVERVLRKAGVRE